MNRWKYALVGLLVGAFAFPLVWNSDPSVIGQTVTVDSTQSPLVVNALADLADLTPTDGQSVIIKTGTEKGLWYYDKDSVAVVDSVAVLTGPGSVGRFLVINNDAGSIAAATPITAAQIDNDVDLEFGVFDADSPRSLTLAELKKTGVQVVNVVQHGADPTGVASSTTAFQAANDALGANGGVVYVPAGNYLISATVTLSNGVTLRGDKHYTPGSVLKSSITDGTAVIRVDNKASVMISDIFINSNTGSLTNCIGIHLDNICNYFTIERVRVRNCQIGMDVEGWISTMTAVYIDYCGTGFIGRSLNGSRIAVATEQCVDHIELIDCNSSTFWLLAEGSASTMETGIVMDGCNYIHLDAPYLEFAAGSTGLLSAISIGETTQCKDITITGGSVYTADTADGSYAVVVDDCNGLRANNFIISTGASQGSRGLNVTSSAKGIVFDGKTSFNFITDDSLTIRPIVNLFSNWDMSRFDDGFTRQVDTSCTVAKESLQSPNYIRTGGQGIRVTSSAGVSLSRTILDLNADVLAAINGKTVTIGAWVYVAASASYGDGTAAMWPSISLYDGISVTTMNALYGKMVPGEWNFVYLKKTMDASSTAVRFYLQPVNGSGTSDGTEFIVLDSLFVAVGDVNPHRMMASMPDFRADGYRHAIGTITTTTDVRWKSASTQTVTLGASCTLTFTAPNAPGLLRLEVSQNGTGGHSITWPTINWKGGTLQPESTASSVSIFDFYFDGTSYHEVNVSNSTDLQLIEASTAGSGAPNVLLGTESAKVLTNEGTTAANYHTLPTAVAGLTYTFVVQDADGLRITAASGDTIRLGPNVTATAGYIESTAIGDIVTVTAINTTEWVGHAYGTWTNGTWTYALADTP